MTSDSLLRLWLVPKPAAEPLAGRTTEATADARTVPTVTLPLEEHAGTVYRYAMRLAGHADVAEDVTQETLLRAWRNREKLRDARTIRVWLLRIATNVWNDELRRKKFRPTVLESEPPCPRRLPGDLADQREQVKLALAAMDELPARQRQVLYLVTCEEMSYAEVAEILGIEMGAVKASLAVARKEMRRRLKDVYEAVCGRTPAAKRRN